MCKTCGRTFSGIAGFRGRHFEPLVIAKAMSHIAAKLSPDETLKQLRMDNITVHPSTLYAWCVHYSDIMDRYSDTLRVDAGFMWHVDELFYKIFKKQERYLFSVMDGASRFVLSYAISTKKKGCDPTGLFEAAAARTMRLPRILVSDGLSDFIKPALKIFYRAAGPLFVHMREIHIQNIFNQNNIMERLNGEFEEKLRCIRGLRSENPMIIRLMIIYHNFFREYEGLGGHTTPAEAIGIKIMPVQDSELSHECDRWITFVENADLYARTVNA